MPIDALSVLCAQLTRDLLAIAKFLFSIGLYRSVRLSVSSFVTKLVKTIF